MAALSSSNVLYIGQTSSWPVESYTTYLCADAISTTIPFYQADNYYSFLRNSFSNTKSVNLLSYSNLTQNYFNAYKANGMSFSSTNSNFTWYPSSFRLNVNAGPQFNYFYINYTPSVEDAYAQYAAYLLYPSRSYLLPLSLTKESDGWVLNTSSVLVKSQIYYFDSKTPEVEASSFHFQNLNSKPSLDPLPSNSTISLVYDLSASVIQTNQPIISYAENAPGFPLSQTPTPFFKNVILGSESISLRPESTFFSYSLGFVPSSNTPKEIGSDFSFSPIIQSFPGETVLGARKFKSLYYTDLNFLSAGKQLFNLVQDTPSFESFSNYFNSDYTILKASLTLSSSYLELSCKNYTAEDGSIISALSGLEYSFIGLTYRGETEFFIDGNSCLSSLLYFKINNTAKNLNEQIVSSNVSPFSASWKTAYPPHYYSYKSSIVAPSLNITKKADSNFLNFDLKLSSQKISPSSVLIIPYFGSEYDFLTYSLSTNNLTSEYIKLGTIEPGKWSKPTIVNLNVLECFYGENLDTPYDLLGEQYIPAAFGSKIASSAADRLNRAPSVTAPRRSA